MKNPLKYLVVCVLILLSSSVIAQVSTYSFGQAAGAPTLLTAPYTQHATGTVDDATYNAVPIGFTFFYNCNSYTTVSICSNGFLAMGNTVTSSYTPLSTGTSNNVIAAMGADLQGLATGSIRTKTTGTAPNRQFTIEWQHFETYLGADDYTFQIVLTETSNLIQIYFSSATTVSGNSFQVGLRGASAADFNNRTKAANTNWTGSAAGAANTDVMTTGATVARNPNGIFTWTPTAPTCAGTPTGGTAAASPNSITTCAALTTSLSLTGATTGCGITYQWQSAPAAGGPWTNVAGATTNPFTASPGSGTTFYRCVVTCTTSGLSANSTSVSVSNTAPVPANNDCSTATNVPVNAGTTCTSVVSGTIACSSASADANTCFGTADDDVWFSFVATGSTATISLNNVVGSTTDLYHSVYSGTCGSLTNLTCSDPNSSTVSGLTVGATYYVRVYSWTSITGQTTTFDICIGNPCPGGAPANDECVNAIAVPVNASTSCTSVVSGTISCSTPSAEANTCFGTDDDDVWFSFVATASAISVNLNSVAGSTTDLYHVIYSGTCGSLTSVLCSDPNNSNLTGLTVGATYYIRVYTWTATAGQTVTFDVCLTQTCPGGAPVNDECVNAIAVTPSTTSCTPVAGTISCSTASAQATTCAGTDDDDVWFSFVASSSSHTINLNNVTGTTTDLYHAVYSGTCGSLTTVTCSDPNSSVLTGLTVGTTYYIRVYSWTATTGQAVNFEVCIMTNGPCGNPANNDYCSNPATLTYNPASSFSSTTAATFTADSPANTGTLFCGSIENNSWYQFTATATSHVFNFSAVTGCASGIQAHVYNITEDVNGCCTNLASVSNCWNPGTATTGTVTATALTIGNTYVLMVDGFGGANCNYTVDDWGATGILPVELLSFEGYGLENDNLLIWKTASEHNNEYFLVERSTDGIQFEIIGRVNSKGNGNSILKYEFADKNVPYQLFYYRIRQVDTDGNSTKSGIVAVKRTNVSQVSYYPNPTLEDLNLDIVANNESDFKIVVADISGKSQSISIRLTPGLNQLKVPFFNLLERGSYVVLVYQDQTLVSTQKIIKQ